MSTPEPANVSPLVEEGPKQDVKSDSSKNNIYTYVLSFVVIALVLYIFYYSYTCFQGNQDIMEENFIERTVKTGTDSDKAFDMNAEIKKLEEKQERNLIQLRNRSK